MADKNARILSSIDKVEKARFKCQAFGTFLFLFSLGLALHARSSSIELKLPIGLFDSGLHNGYTLIFGPAAILLVMTAAYFQRRSFVSLQKKVQLDIDAAKLSNQLTELEKRELNGSEEPLAWVSNVGPFFAAAICAVTITWVFGDFQYPYVKLKTHEELVSKLTKLDPSLASRLKNAENKNRPVLVNVFEPHTYRKSNKLKQLSVSEVRNCLNGKAIEKHNLKDNYSWLFLGPPDGFKSLYSPWHEKVDPKNYKTMPSIDHWQALLHLLATIVACILAACIVIPICLHSSD